MQFAALVKEVRKQLNISQMDLAEHLSVSYSTVNRWESGRVTPNKLAQKSFYEFCNKNNINIALIEATSKLTDYNTTVTLYHGSKSGIVGKIRPKSRDFCDFGRGFYMGTEKSQPLTLICNFSNAKLYQVEFDLRDLSVLDIDVSIDWALLVAYNRGKMDDIKGTPLYEKFETMANRCDVIIGSIANDRMFVVLDRFFSGEITDKALVSSLSALQLGRQYVAITEKACEQITIKSEKAISEKEKKELIKISEQNRKDGINKAEEICRKYRREGKFFDEILAGGVLGYEGT